LQLVHAPGEAGDERRLAQSEKGGAPSEQLPALNFLLHRRSDR
jgi:hypothetical protein